MLITIDDQEIKLDPFTLQYLVTALWSSYDNSDDQGGEFLDQNYSIHDFTLEALQSAIKDCNQFREENAKHLEEIEDEQAGHDFWLTRCGHGAGFWDRGHPEPIGTALTAACEVFGNVDPYLTDHGMVDLFGG
jgi:hypothetical protein